MTPTRTFDLLERYVKQFPGRDVLAEKIDGKKYLAFPGFVDPHTHPVFYKTREEEFEMRITILLESF